MAKDCGNHQSLRLIKVDGERPPSTEWYECKCGYRLLVHILATYPQDNDAREARKEGITVEKQFISVDRTTWGSLELARRRNKLLREIETLEKNFLLARTPELEDGLGYLQQDPHQVSAVKHTLLSILKREYGVPTEMSLNEAISHINREDPRSFRESPIYHLMARLAMIDEGGREWQTSAIAEDPKAAGARITELPPPKK